MRTGTDRSVSSGTRITPCTTVAYSNTIAQHLRRGCGKVPGESKGHGLCVASFNPMYTREAGSFVGEGKWSSPQACSRF